MQSIKRKLSSRSGASMLLALVFLLFCLFVGGSVLASATANGGRVDDLTTSQQEYLNQRSAMLLMAQMLEGEDGADLQLTIKEEVTSASSGETTKVTFTIQDTDTNKSILEKILYETAVGIYMDSHSINQEYAAFQNFMFSCVSGSYDYTPQSSNSGTFSITPALGTNFEAEVLPVKYDISNYDLNIYFHDETGEITPLLTLTMNGTFSDGHPVTITADGVTTTTTTSVVRWEAPVIQKGGA